MSMEDDLVDRMAYDAKYHGAYDAAEYIRAFSIPLPMSADGFVIALGDTVWADVDTWGMVERMSYDSESEHPWHVYADTAAMRLKTVFPSEMYTHRPDSLERIADEIEEADVDGCTDWADRIRKLAEKEEE